LAPFLFHTFLVAVSNTDIVDKLMRMTVKEADHWNMPRSPAAAAAAAAGATVNSDWRHRVEYGLGLVAYCSHFIVYNILLSVLCK